MNTTEISIVNALRANWEQIRNAPLEERPALCGIPNTFKTRHLVDAIITDIEILASSTSPVQKLNTYQNNTELTNSYFHPDERTETVLPTLVLALASEAGEVAGKVSKMFRDEGGALTEQRKQEILLELGDVLYFVSAICTALDVPLEQVANMNLQKIASRMMRGKIGGDGDNR
jgi:NTP pyrophosphatase (non-canonical NTP hydrolase)